MLFCFSISFDEITNDKYYNDNEDYGQSYYDDVSVSSSKTYIQIIHIFSFTFRLARLKIGIRVTRYTRIRVDVRRELIDIARFALILLKVVI